MTLKGKEIVLGISGGIACYKSIEIVRGIKEAGGNVSVVMTKAATEFVQPLTFQTLSERPVATHMFSLYEESKIGHIKIGENADAIVVAPATANIIGKTANGIADDYLSTVLLACDAPLIVAPAMNHKMWDHPAVQENISTLINRGAHIVQPDSGFLACGTFGTGRMSDPHNILLKIKEVIELTSANSGRLEGIKVLVTAGPTRERIDAVRYLTNDSSGKMGYAIAEYCHQQGADVTLISGPSNLPNPRGIKTIRVTSAEEMYQEVFKVSKETQLVIKAAAVSDYTVSETNKHKLKKKDNLELSLIKTKDILKELGKNKQPTQFLVGFAAESEQVEEYARQKLEAKNLDLVIANNIIEKDAGFEVNTNRVVIISQKGSKPLPLMTKAQVAEKIIDEVLSHDRWKTVKNAIQKCAQ